MRAYRALVAKDLRIEARTRSVLLVMALFAILTVVLFHFSFDVGIPDEVVVDTAAGMMWLAFAFSGVLGLSRSFALERERESMRGLLLAPVDRSVIYGAKLTANVILLTLVEWITYPIFGVLLDLPWIETLPEMFLVFFLATVGFAAPGTLFAAASSNLRLRDAMLPVLLFPIVLPALIAGEMSTAALLRGEGLAVSELWLKVLVAVDVIFVTLGVLLFEFVVEE
jgi:heme exporter protein B